MSLLTFNRPFTYAILVSIFFISHVLSFCPTGSFELPSENVCAIPYATPQYYLQADRQCRSVGGMVSKIQNSFENAYLSAMNVQDFNSQPPYIGVERNSNGAWVYADGSPITYSNWAPGEPKNGTALCAILDPKTAKWNTSDCNVGRPFFCTVNENGGPCPNHWAYLPYTDSCYYLQDFTYSNGVNWTSYTSSEAESKCQQMGAHLASVHSDTEMNFLYSLTISNIQNLAFPITNHCLYGGAWIGYYGTGVVGNGNWTDGSRVDYVVPIFSHPGAPQYWAIINDPSCDRQYWDYWSDQGKTARFVCKTPASSMIKNKNLVK
ncbi:unnamed protein product, partial [Mesorhabditis belari]|uniref:C-type lectin domain-containing protein n=1 Tax=Mesorhabditis belari TaxID=2138241 RepID=A0AAF3JAK1_9BILA